MARFASSRLEQPIELVPQAGKVAGELTIHIPGKAEDITVLKRWVPGFYTVALVQKRSGVPSISSNELAFALAPQISVTPNNAASGTVALTLTCEPRIVSGQRVLLAFGDRQLEPDSISTPADETQPTTLKFTVTDVKAGENVVRLRVDGADSIPVLYSGMPPVPSFDPTQKVIVA